jgi:hypothetical protein
LANSREGQTLTCSSCLDRPMACHWATGSGGFFEGVEVQKRVSKAVPSLGYHHLWLAIPSYCLCLRFLHPRFPWSKQAPPTETKGKLPLEKACLPSLRPRGRPPRPSRRASRPSGARVGPLGSQAGGCPAAAAYVCCSRSTQASSARAEFTLGSHGNL